MLVTGVAGWYIYFNTNNPKQGYILESLGMENAGIFYGHLKWHKCMYINTLYVCT
jgi:hypothetical protein